jgi:hypothetical protein
MSKNKKTARTENGNIVDVNRDYGNISYSHKDLPGRSYDSIYSIDRDMKENK